MKLRFFDRHARWRELAGARASAELDARDQQRFDAHAASCADCRALVTDMAALRSMLRDLPDVEAPRSFHLTHAMVERAPRPSPRQRPGYVMRGAQLAAGFAAAALAVVVVVDVVPSNGGDETTVLGAGADQDTLAPLADTPEQREIEGTSGDDGGAFAQESPTSAFSQATGTAAADDGNGSTDAGAGSPTLEGGQVGGASVPGAEPVPSPAPGQSPPPPPATGPDQGRETGRLEDKSAPATAPAERAGIPELAAKEPANGEDGGAGFRIAEGILGGLLFAAALTWAGAWFVRRRSAE